MHFGAQQSKIKEGPTVFHGSNAPITLQYSGVTKYSQTVDVFSDNIIRIIKITSFFDISNHKMHLVPVFSQLSLLGVEY